MDKVLTWLSKLLPLLAYYPRWFQYFVVAVLAALLFVIFFMLVGYSSASAASKGAVDDDGLPPLIGLARQNDVQKYVIESATMIVTLDPAVQQQVAGELTMETRFIYTIFALQDLRRGDFTESVHGTGGVARLAGSNEGQAESPDSENQRALKSWIVPVDLKKGQRTTIATGTVYLEKAPFAPRQHHQFQLTETQDAFCYPNSEDVIGQLTIMVQSTLPLLPSVNGDAGLNTRRPAGTGDDWGTPEFHNTDSEGIHRSVVAYRWANVVPGQVAGVRVSWKR
jgi:hypothetical protein